MCGRVRPRPAALHLLEAMFGPDRPADREVAAHLVAGEDLLNLLVDFVGGAEAGLRTAQPPLKVDQVIEGGGQALTPTLFLA